MKKELITWENEQYSTNELLDKLHISKTSFYRHKKNGCTSVDSIKKCLDNRRSTYTYQDKTCSIYSLANDLEIDPVTIYKYINLGYSLDECIPIILENKKMKYDPTKNKKVEITYFPYKGKNLTLGEIAKRENVASSNLYRRVMVEKEDLESAILEIKKNQLIRKHYSRLLEEKAKVLKVGDISLFQYCLDHEYNYRAIIEKIMKYNMSVIDAIDEYVTKGQDTTRQKFSYKHEDVILKHLFMKYHLNSSYAMKLRNDFDNIDDLIVKLCFSSTNELYNKNEGLYLYELYSLFSVCNEAEKKMWISELGVTKRQIELLEMEHKRISFIQREFLYYELEPVLKTCSKKERESLVKVYGITNQELAYINNGIYEDFTLVECKKGKVYIKQPNKQ